MNNVTVPAHIAARIAERNKTGAKSALTDSIVTAGPSIPKISIRAAKFRLVTGGVETVVGDKLDVIIVGVNPRVSKTYFNKAFDPNAEDKRPACFSNDGIRPDEDSQTPQSDSCASCPHNVLGSKINASGAKSKKCADQRHLAVVPAADPKQVYSLSVTVAAMKGLRTYFGELANYNIAPEEAITELGFDEQASYPRLMFSQKGYVPEKALPLIDTLLNCDDTKIAIRTMAPRPVDPALSAPPAHAQMEAPQSSFEDDEASGYDEGGPTASAPPPPPEEPPTVAPVKQSDELEAKLDSLFD